MKKMMAPISISIALLLALATVLSAAAAPARYVHIEAHEYIGQNNEPFLASGPAVDAGLICDSGTTADGSNTGTYSVGSITYFQVVKTFTCDDFSGSFDVQLSVRLNTSTHRTTAAWTVIGGTGDYASLEARGSLVGTPGDVPGGDIYDTYNGIAR